MCNLYISTIEYMNTYYLCIIMPFNLFYSMWLYSVNCFYLPNYSFQRETQMGFELWIIYVNITEII